MDMLFQVLLSESAMFARKNFCPLFISYTSFTINFNEVSGEVASLYGNC